MEKSDSLKLDITNSNDIFSMAYSHSYWIFTFLLSLAILILISLYFIHLRIKNSKNLDSKLADTITNFKNNSVDMKNIVISINNAPELYKNLTKMYHPDKYVGTEYEETANEIFQTINSKRRDFNALCEIKKLAEEKLPTKT
jgi:hypothetical protein